MHLFCFFLALSLSKAKILPFIYVLNDQGNNHMNTSAGTLQPTSVIKWLILLPELAAYSSMGTQEVTHKVPSASSVLLVTAGKHLPALFIKTSAGQWSRTAGGQQCSYHYGCFCSEHLPTPDALPPDQAQMTNILIHSAIKMHALQSGGHMCCSVLHVPPCIACIATQKIRSSP